MQPKTHTTIARVSDVYAIIFHIRLGDIRLIPFVYCDRGIPATAAGRESFVIGFKTGLAL